MEIIPVTAFVNLANDLFYIAQGGAYKFQEFVEAQGGRLKDIEISNHVIHVKASKSGLIKKIDALGCAKLACKLGASKMTLDDKIDYSAGIKVLKKTLILRTKK